jgi:hypothetical protein
MLEPYDTLFRMPYREFQTFAECLAHTLTVGISFPLLWALYLTPPTTTFKRTSVSVFSWQFWKNFATIPTKQTLLAKGLSFKHLKSWLEVVFRSLSRRKRIGYRHTSERIRQRYYVPARQPYVTLVCLV